MDRFLLRKADCYRNVASSPAKRVGESSSYSICLDAGSQRNCKADELVGKGTITPSSSDQQRVDTPMPSYVLALDLCTSIELGKRWLVIKLVWPLLLLGLNSFWPNVER